MGRGQPRFVVASLEGVSRALQAVAGTSDVYPAGPWPLRPATMAAMRRAIALITIIVALAGQALAGDPVEWRVVSVHDGDTITCLDEGNKQHRIRIDGIDAPERGQPFGNVARDRMTTLAKGKTATIHGHGNDRYGRLLATVEIEGDDLGLRLVAEGLAWHYVQFNNDPLLAAAEQKARVARRGLWADAKPVPPWEWRASVKARKQSKGQD